MFKVVAIGITGAVLAVTIKQHKPELATLVSIATGLVILALVLDEALGLVDKLIGLAERFSIDGDIFTTVLKITGVAYISEFGVQACVDAGEQGIASKVELGAKVIILAMCVPIVASILDMLQQMLPS